MMRSVRITLISAVVVAAAFCSTAKADLITFTVPTGPFAGSYSIDQVNFQAGNTVAVNGTNIAPGDVINTFYQSNVSSLTNSHLGTNVPGVGSSYFLTGVLGLSEVVSTVSTTAGVTTATFSLATPAQAAAAGVAYQNYADVYYNTTGPGNNSTGVGFNSNGTLILHSTITSESSSFSDVPTGTNNVPFATNTFGANYPGTTSSVGLPNIVPGGPSTPGAGGFTISSQVVYANPTYLPTLAGTTMSFFLPQGSLSDQFSAVPATSTFYTGSQYISPSNPQGGIDTPFSPTPGNVNGQPALFGGTGTDFLFQSTVSAGFTVQALAVPEPASLTLLALSMVPMGVYALRRRRNRNAGE